MRPSGGVCKPLGGSLKFGIMRRPFFLSLLIFASCASPRSKVPATFGSDQAGQPREDRPTYAARAWSSVKGGLHAVSSGADALTHGAVEVFDSAAGKVGKVFKLGGPKKPAFKVEILGMPNPLSVSKSKSLNLRIQLTNTGKKLELLEFASTQRVDAVIKDAAGKIVARAGDAMEVQPEAGFVTANPGERLEFGLTLPLQELQPGKRYHLDAAVIGQSGLNISMPLTVVP